MNTTTKLYTPKFQLIILYKSANNGYNKYIGLQEYIGYIVHVLYTEYNVCNYIDRYK